MLVRPRYCVFVVRLLIVSRRRLHYAARGASTLVLCRLPPFTFCSPARANERKIQRPRVATLSLGQCP